MTSQVAASCSPHPGLPSCKFLPLYPSGPLMAPTPGMAFEESSLISYLRVAALCISFKLLIFKNSIF